MADTPAGDCITATCQQYQTLLAVSEAIVANRDLHALFHELSGLLHRLLEFDYLALVLYEPKTDMMRLHVLEASGPVPASPPLTLAADETPQGHVLHTQQPLVVSDTSRETRWQRFRELIKPLGAMSSCNVPLTTARSRLGVLCMASKQRAMYDRLDLSFMRHLANQVAVAVENALAFGCIEHLKEKLTQEKVYLEQEIRTESNFEQVVGDSTVLRKVLKEVETVASTSSTVLVIGETGTGKELIARAVHDLSPRRDRTFIKLNCAAIPSGLLESELFGHEKGAFTGAIAQKIGRFELAHQGTLFLDEIGDIPLELQPKLLRVLQEQEFERLGSTKTVRVDIRLIAATNRNLAEMVQEGNFRNDLYYRLNVFPVSLPPLRDRQGDIPLLVRHFTDKFARRMGKRIDTVPAEAMDALARYTWPGNIRELENVIERAVILSPSNVLRINVAEMKSLPVQQASAGSSHDGVTLADAERDHIVAALRAAKGRLGGPSGAAARLGIKRTTLQSRMKKLGISNHG